MAGGGPDTQGRRGITWYWPSGGDVEGKNDDSQYPLQCLHKLTRKTSMVSGKVTAQAPLPWVEMASSLNDHEGGDPVRNISGSSQCICCL